MSENPELIFYGRHSGVVGLSKNELYKTINDVEVSRCGYDKVKLHLVLNQLAIEFISFFFSLSFANAKLTSTCNFIQVLVDAECTHDGSVRHIQKFEHWGWTTLQHRVLDAERTDSLAVLQAVSFFHKYILFNLSF